MVAAEGVGVDKNLGTASGEGARPERIVTGVTARSGMRWAGGVAVVMYSASSLIAKIEARRQTLSEISALASWTSLHMLSCAPCLRTSSRPYMRAVCGPTHLNHPPCTHSQPHSTVYTTSPR